MSFPRRDTSCKTTHPERFCASCCRSSQTPLRVVGEPEEADRPRTCMRADHRAERGLLLDLRLRPQVAHHLLELAHALRRVGVRDPDAQVRRVLRLRAQRVDELLERLLV